MGKSAVVVLGYLPFTLLQGINNPVHWCEIVGITAL